MNDGKKTSEELLSWRPRSAREKIPRDVFDARMSLLSEDDATAMKNEFDSGRDPDFPFLWFGGKFFENYEDNVLGTMTRCAYVGKDAETTARLFKASGYSDFADGGIAAGMIDDAVKLADKYREQMAQMNRRRFPHVKPRYVTHAKHGNYRY